MKYIFFFLLSLLFISCNKSPDIVKISRIALISMPETDFNGEPWENDTTLPDLEFQIIENPGGTVETSQTFEESSLPTIWHTYSDVFYKSEWDKKISIMIFERDPNLLNLIHHSEEFKFSNYVSQQPEFISLYSDDFELRVELIWDKQK